MTKFLINIDVGYDFESGMFLAQSFDVPGLATEAASYDKLIKRVVDVVPELLELNGIDMLGRSEIPLAFHQKSHCVSMPLSGA